MAQPFKQQTDEITRETRMQEFYNSLDHHLKGEYRVMQTYRSVFVELQDVSVSLKADDLYESLGCTIATIDKFLYGHENVLDVIESMPVFNGTLETMLLETKLDLSNYEGGDLIY